MQPPEAVVLARTFLPIAKGAKAKYMKPELRLFGALAFDATDCWYFRGAHCKLGYGVCSAFGERRAHRAMWVAFNGRIPDGKHVLHTCDVRCCVNPDHLFLGTHADNMRDMVRKGRHVRPDLKGEQHPNSKITCSIARSIRELGKAGLTQQAIADQFGISRANVGLVLQGKAWKE